MGRHADRVQAGLDLGEGRVFRAVRYELGGGEPPRLLLVAHHLVVDGVSWRVLLADLERGLRQRRGGSALALPPRTTSVRDWHGCLAAWSESESARASARWWLAQPFDAVGRIPADRAAGANTFGAVGDVTVELTAEETAALLTGAPRAYHARVDDVLLAALARALGAWTGTGCCSVDLEGHGRDDEFDGVDLSRTVGWLTSLYPVVLDVRGLAEPDALLVAVKEQLRSVPRRGLGFGVMRYLTSDDALAASLRELPRPEVSFNYLGQYHGGDDTTPARC
jgi:hypothetical protein